MSKNKVSLDVIDSILGGGNEAPQESRQQAEASPSIQKRGKGRPKEDEYEARTFRVKRELVQKLKYIARREGRLQKDVLEKALEKAISSYEERHGVINKDFEEDSLDDLF